MNARQDNQRSAEEPGRKSPGPDVAASDSLLKQLMALSPQTDRGALVKTVDSAVANVLQRLRVHERGTPLAEDLVRLARTTLGFLEACSSLKDPEFVRQSKAWAAQLQEAFVSAAAPAGKPQPAKPAKPAPPAVAAKGADGKKEKKDPAPATPAKPASATELFQAAFEEHFCRFIRRKVEAFEVMGAQADRLPYVVAPAYSLIFEQIIKAHVVPRMLANRRVKTLVTTMKEGGYDEAAFRGVFEAHGSGNVVKALWNDVWEEIEHALLSQDKTAQEREKKKKNPKKSWFDRVSTWRSHSREKDDDEEVYDLELAKRVMDAFEAGGVDGNFDPPKGPDIPIIRAAFDFDLDAIETAKTSAKQLMQQEASGKAREGVTRDFLNQQFKALPANCGEMLALWAYFQNRDQFNYKILRSFEASHGQNPAQRKKYLPLFMRWVPDFTHLKPKI